MSCFGDGAKGSGGSRSKNLLEGAMKQMLVWGDNLRLQDEARSLELGHQQHPGPESQDSQHMLNQSRQLFLEIRQLSVF